MAKAHALECAWAFCGMDLYGCWRRCGVGTVGFRDFSDRIGR